MIKELNISELLIDNGFAVSCGCLESTKDFKPKNNFFGVSLYHPEVMFTKGQKEVIISLQSLSVPDEAFVLHSELGKKRAIKMIRFTNNNELIYNTYTGILPNKEVINQFLNL